MLRLYFPKALRVLPASGLGVHLCPACSLKPRALPFKRLPLSRLTNTPFLVPTHIVQSRPPSLFPHKVFPILWVLPHPIEALCPCASFDAFAPSHLAF